MLKKQSNPLALRMSDKEKEFLNRISKQVKCSRHRFMRIAVLGLASQLQAEKLIEV